MGWKNNKKMVLDHPLVTLIGLKIVEKLAHPMLFFIIIVILLTSFLARSNRGVARLGYESWSKKMRAGLEWLEVAPVRIECGLYLVLCKYFNHLGFPRPLFSKRYHLILVVVSIDLKSFCIKIDDIYQRLLQNFN